MNVEQVGSFRTRTADDGSLEVWARGWRLESQLYALIPMGLSLAFLFAPMALPMRVGGAGIMLGASLFVFRMTKPGMWFGPSSIQVVSVWRTLRFDWARVSVFMGERSHDEARIYMLLDDERRVPLPGTLDPAELDPYGDEGQLLSAADQLNQLKEQAVRGQLPKPAAPVLPAPAPEGAHTREERRSERKAVRAALKTVRTKPAPARVLPPLGDEELSRKDRRADRKAVRAALKELRANPGGLPVHAAPARKQEQDEPTPRRRSLRRRAAERQPALTEVPIGEPEPVAVAPKKPEPVEVAGMPSYFPKPVYIPQAEYAQMLRDQKAAEKAAAEAAAELRRLADLEEIDELAEKDEFSDWTSSSG